MYPPRDSPMSGRDTRDSPLRRGEPTATSQRLSPRGYSSLPASSYAMHRDSPVRRTDSPIRRDSPLRRTNPEPLRKSFGNNYSPHRNPHDSPIRQPPESPYKNTYGMPQQRNHNDSPLRKPPTTSDSPMRRQNESGGYMAGSNSPIHQVPRTGASNYLNKTNNSFGGSGSGSGGFGGHSGSGVGLSSGNNSNSNSNNSHNHSQHTNTPPNTPPPPFGNNSPITQVSRDAQPTTPPLFLNTPKDFMPPEPDPRTFTPLLPPKDKSMQHRNTLVLDLDETLVHSSFQPITLVDMLLEIELDGQNHTVYVRKRPHVEEFLSRLCQLYEVVVLTASLEVYANPVLDELDYEGYWVHHRLFRDSCANLNGNYIKDLSYLGRPLHQVIIIDNSPTSYLFQPRNALPISSWFDDPTDGELKDLLPVLERAAKVDNIFPVLDAYRQAMANGEKYYP